MKSSLIIRFAHEADISALAELWHDKMQIKQQFNPLLRLAGTAKDDWSTAILELMAQPGTVIFLAESNEIIGFIRGTIQTNAVGLLPPEMGIINELVLNMHSYQGGAGQQLVMALQKWFTEQGITQIQVSIPHNFAPEEAFWQTMTTKQIATIVWLKI